jgi:single-strand DNA-binding protein
VIFNEHLCKVAENYLKKGSKIYIEGSLQTRKWTDNAGVEKYSTEVVLQRYNGELTMLDGRGDTGGYSQDGGSSDNYNQAASGGGGGSAPASEKPGFDDEIPF